MEKIKAKNIQWDTDGYKPRLPKFIIVELPDDVIGEDEISDFVSDKITDITGYCHKGFELVPVYEPYAISTSDGHDEDWSYYPNKREYRKAFNKLKKTEDDIHGYKLTKNDEYEVIDSYWIGDKE